MHFCRWLPLCAYYWNWLDWRNNAVPVPSSQTWYCVWRRRIHIRLSTEWASPQAARLGFLNSCTPSDASQRHLNQRSAMYCIPSLEDHIRGRGQEAPKMTFAIMGFSSHQKTYHCVPPSGAFQNPSEIIKMSKEKVNQTFERYIK